MQLFMSIDKIIIRENLKSPTVDIFLVFTRKWVNRKNFFICDQSPKTIRNFEKILGNFWVILRNISTRWYYYTERILCQFLPHLVW